MIGKDLLNYRILARLGAGGQGTVYQALDTNLNRTVAIKVLAPNLTSNAVNLERFKREAQLASSLEHPNICTIYELDEADGVHFIVMQFVEGQNIRQLVNGHPLELETALRIGAQVADALANAHASSIVHRDIKAGNVMVTNNGLVKVLDFGLAKLLEDDSETSVESDRDEQLNLTELGSPYGTATYAAPEQARGERVDHRADIFSTGVLLYEMLAGTWPFRGKNAVEVRHAVLHDEALPIEQRRGVPIPPRLEAVVDKSIAKLPDERYQNISELRDELTSVLLEVSASQTEVLPVMQRAEFAPQPLKRDDPLVRAARWVTNVFKGEKSQEHHRSGSSISTFETTRDHKSLAVLPFRNLRSDSNSDFYGFALADAVITELSRVGSFEVRPSASILQYSDKEVDPIGAARELNVRWILSSNFISEGDCLHVTTQLLDAETGSLIWGEALEVTAENIIDLQNGIADRLVEALTGELGCDKEKHHPSSKNQAAAFAAYLRGRDAMKSIIHDALSSYDEYLRGRHAVGGYVYPAPTLQDIDVAISHFLRATEIDSNFAQAYSSLGSCYTSKVIRFAGDSGDYELAKEAFEKALALDPNNIEAKVNLAFFQMAQGRKELARKEIAQMLEQVPFDVAVNFVNAYLSRLDGAYEEALSSLDHVLRFNPNAAVVVSYNRARIFVFQGEYEKALQELNEGEQLAPEHPLIKTFRAMCLLLMNKATEARDLLRETIEKNPELEGIRPHLAMCLAATGDNEGARLQITDRVREMASVSHDIPYWLATVYVMLDNDEEAFHWLEKAIELGNENLPWFKRNPLWKRLHDDACFVSVMKRVEQARTIGQSLLPKHEG